MFERECKVMTKVLKINYKLFPNLIKRRSLKILKLLMIVIAPRIPSDVLAEMKILIKDPQIITKSKMFQPSLKYIFGV
jgi:hypothetical protein